MSKHLITLLWIIFAKYSINSDDQPRVLIYINSRLISLQFLLRKNIYSHRDINLISFVNHGFFFFILNVYSDNCQSALKYLKDIEVNLNNIIIMMGDFNIRDSDWDLSFPHHSVHADLLLEIAESFNLELSSPVI